MTSKPNGSPAEGDVVEEAVTDGAEADREVIEETAVDETAVDETAADESVAASDHRPGPAGRALSWCRQRWIAVLLAVLLVASAGAAAGVYWRVYRPDQLTTPAAQQQAVEAARQGTVALLTYSPDTLDKDLAAAKSHLTGEFLKYYSQFTDTIVAPAAKQKGVKTEANVVRAAVSDMQPDRAVVLVFVNQVTTSRDRPDPALATSSVMVTMVKSSGNWLISEFNPV